MASPAESTAMYRLPSRTQCHYGSESSVGLMSNHRIATNPGREGGIGFCKASTKNWRRYKVMPAKKKKLLKLTQYT